MEMVRPQPTETELPINSDTQQSQGQDRARIQTKLQQRELGSPNRG